MVREEVMDLARRLDGYDTAEGCGSCIAEGTAQCCLSDDCTVSVCKRIAMDLYEIAGKEAEDATTVSAYDLLGDDDREAIAWVREMGGVEAAKARTMPEGCEWPRYEDGEPVQFGDETNLTDAVESITLNADGTTLVGDKHGDFDAKYVQCVKRPQVLAADGEPLEVGQTVWDVGNGVEFTVIGLPNPGEYQAVKLRLDDGAFTGLDPDQLTHQRPVLDADGMPIREGDTVWDATTSAGPFTVREIERSDDPDEPEDIVWCGEHAANGFKVWRIADQLTNTKPEPPDSRQAIVNEIGDEMAARIDLLVSSGRWSDAD